MILSPSFSSSSLICSYVCASRSWSIVAQAIPAIWVIPQVECLDHPIHTEFQEHRAFEASDPQGPEKVGPREVHNEYSDKCQYHDDGPDAVKAFVETLTLLAVPLLLRYLSIGQVCGDEHGDDEGREQ